MAIAAAVLVDQVSQRIAIFMKMGRGESLHRKNKLAGTCEEFTY